MPGFGEILWGWLGLLGLLNIFAAMRILYIALLIAAAVASLVALILLPYKVVSTVFLVISLLGLLVYYLLSGNEESDESGRKKYSDVLISEEMERYFSRKKPFLNPNYKISDLEKYLKVNRNAILSFIQAKYRRNFNQYLDLWRITELQRLQSLMENEDVDINVLCKKAGFSDAQQYKKAEVERRAINRKKTKGKGKHVIKNLDIDDELDFKKKPEIQIRV